MRTEITAHAHAPVNEEPVQGHSFTNELFPKRTQEEPRADLFANPQLQPGESQAPVSAAITIRSLGKFTLASSIGMGNRVLPPTAENAARCARTLHTVLMNFENGGFRWALTGGIAIDMLMGRLSRSHADLDIQVPAEDAPVLLKHLASCGRNLQRKLMSGRSEAGITSTFYCSAELKDCEPSNRRGVKILTLPHENLLPHIHFRFTRCSGQTTIVDFRGGPITVDRELAVPTADFRGKSIPLVPTALELFWRAITPTPKARHDHQLLWEAASDEDRRYALALLKSSAA